MTVPVGPASISFGGDGAGVGIAIGAGLAFETSPTSFTQSVSMSYDEMGVAMVNFLKKSGIMYVSYDKTNPNLDEKGNIIGFSGVVTFSGGSNILQYDVSCKAVKGEPSNQWETRAYTSNKQGE